MSRAETEFALKCNLFLSKCNLLLIKRPSNRSYTTKSGGCVSLNYYERDLQYAPAQYNPSDEHSVEYYGFEIIYKNADEKECTERILNCECPSIAMSHIWIKQEKFYHKTHDYYNENESVDKLSKIFNIDHLEQLIQGLDYFLSQGEFETFYEILISRVYSIASKAHEKQTDKSGVPYINHVLFVAKQMDTDDEYITALLHDVVEDTGWNFKDLETEGVPQIVISALKLLTHDDDSDYYDYVRHIKSNPLAVKVKLADLRHNSDPERLASLPPETAERLKQKYTEAMRILESEKAKNSQSFDMINERAVLHKKKSKFFMAGFNKKYFASDVCYYFVLLHRSWQRFDGVKDWPDDLKEFFKFESAICSEMYAFLFTYQLMKSAGIPEEVDLGENIMMSYLEFAVPLLENKPKDMDDESLNFMCELNAKVFTDIYVAMKKDKEGIYLHEFEPILKAKYREDFAGLSDIIIDIIIEIIIIATDLYGKKLSVYRTWRY